MKIFPKGFKIGARTIKTVIAASLAIMIADMIGLEYATAAGIIAILSVGNTKKSTYQLGKNRLLNFIFAMVFATILFTILGHHVLVFALFLLFFIPCSAAWGIAEGIAPNAVLVTHLLVAKEITPELLLNEFLLNIIAISLAFLVNWKMPNFQNELTIRERRIEHHFQDLFKRLSYILDKQTEKAHFLHKVEDLETYITDSLALARTHMDNNLVDHASHSYDYLTMRARQVELFRELTELLVEIDLQSQAQAFEKLKDLLLAIGENYGRDNNAQALTTQAQEVLAYYRASELPKTRHEFEVRAQLFQILQLIQSFIQIKHDYVLETRL
ncbi:MAG: aromatic acid exporter family protein [Lactococcus plantarum]|nr:aromatic acid exporter family protein [Lactococcus plantarum]MDN6085226.1 aromatic acid exporter family protein [Lactococcus plantarum]